MNFFYFVDKKKGRLINEKMTKFAIFFSDFILFAQNCRI
jgi:hypothetical protein